MNYEFGCKGYLLRTMIRIPHISGTGPLDPDGTAEYLLSVSSFDMKKSTLMRSKKNQRAKNTVTHIHILISNYLMHNGNFSLSLSAHINCLFLYNKKIAYVKLTNEE